MQHVNGIPVYSSDPTLFYKGLDVEPTWFSAQGGVYKCRERKKSAGRVAIKKYLVEENQHEDMFVMPKELVENEIYTMTKCVHPHILKLYAVYLHQEFVYLVMPLCTGGSLQQYVFDHQLTIGQLVYIISSIASGLAEIHRHNYIHRDIKCDNIFLDVESNAIVIGDFGVVSVTPTADSDVEEAGVVLFWSPELVNRQVVSCKVDIWALGIVILEILNGGKAPYEDDKLEEEEIKQRILDNGKPAYPSGLPQGLEDLLDRCLEIDPEARTTAKDLLEHPFLCAYKPEALYPATRLDHDISSLSGSEPSESVSEHTTHVAVTNDVAAAAASVVGVVGVGVGVTEKEEEKEKEEDDDVMMNALKKLKAFEALNELDLTLTQSQSTTIKASAQQSTIPPTIPQAIQTTTESTETGTITSTSTTTVSVVDQIPSDLPRQEDIIVSTSTMNSSPHVKPNSRKSHVPQISVPIPGRQCRLPVPSFIAVASETSAMPSKERIDSVMRKRQTMLDSHRNQGSRLPWLKWTLPVLHAETPKVKVQSTEPVPFKTMSRSYTMPAGISQIGKPVNNSNGNTTTTATTTSSTSGGGGGGLDRNRTRRADAVKSVNEIDRSRKNIPSRSTSAGQRAPTKPRPASAGRLSEDKSSLSQQQVKPAARPRVLLSNGPGRKPRPLPPKASVFRQKRLPSESRTARLTMGISARPLKENNEDSNNNSNKSVPPPMPSRIGRLLSVKSDEKEGKRRPVSFAGTSAQQRPDGGLQRSDGSLLEPNRRYGHLIQPVATRTTPLPKQDVRVRRQSAPLVDRPEKLSGSNIGSGIGLGQRSAQKKNKTQDESKTQGQGQGQGQGQRNGDSKPPLSKNSALKGVKTVRVH